MVMGMEKSRSWHLLQNKIKTLLAIWVWQEESEVGTKEDTQVSVLGNKEVVITLLI